MFEEYVDKHKKIIQYISWRRHEFDIYSPIIFKNVSLTVGYKPILKKVSFKLNPLSRVGIVGTGGAGRSTILHILCCMKEPDENKQTFISILGVPIHHFDTRLMKDVFLIERTPNLLEGTIRSNIDPYNTSTDEQIRRVLILLEIEAVF